MLLRLALACLVVGLTAPILQADDPVAPAAAAGQFEGVWLGEIVAPNTRAVFGLAFTRTPKGFLVSVYFPEMFLYSANFGPADIREGVFHFPPLNLELSRKGETLTGTFAPAKLPVELHRGGSFAPEPPAPSFPPARPPVWEKSLGAGAWASPVIHEGILYVGTIDGRFHAVRADNGNDVWLWIGDSPLYGAAAVSGDHVFFLNERGELIALRTSDGSLEWKVALSTDANAAAPPNNPTFNHRAAAPVLDAKGTTVYTGSFDGGIYAIKASNGRLLWRHDAKAPIYATLGLQGNQLAAGCFDGSVLVLDRTSRKEILRTKLPGAIVSTPISVDGRWVIGARDYMLYGLDQTTDAIAWRDSYWFSWVESTPRLDGGLLYIGGSDFRRVSAVEPKTGRMRWSTDVRGLSWGTPLVTNAVVYASTAGQNLEGTVIQHTGGIVAIERSSGAVKWRFPIIGNAGDAFVGSAGSLTSAAGMLIAATLDGRLVALPLDAN